jgi:tetratricopeptide (TPR) repeat protein
VSEALDAATERRLAVELFNRAWELLALPERTAEQDDELVHAAHASRFHWIAAGTAINAARGEWQCSRVYASLGRAEPALHHARRCLALAEAAPDAEDWDVPFAYEALARAHAVAGHAEEASRRLAQAREALPLLADPEDREQLANDLATVPVQATSDPAT